MNNSGKSNAVFLILIPLFFVLALIIVDTVFNILENNRLKKTTESIIGEVMNNKDISIEEYGDEIKKAYERLGYETEMLVVEANGYDVYVENEHSYFGIFSSFSNKKNIESDVSILGITFKVRKNSVARVKVSARFDYNDKLVFEYTE